MINETRKILNKPMLPVTATCVRVPVMNCHSESINIEFKTTFDIYDVKMLLQNSPGIILVDDIEKDYYPLATKADGYDEVFVGRIRRDFSVLMVLIYGLLLIICVRGLLQMRFKF